MSKFSGKCDFYDHLFMSADSEEKVINELIKTDFYVRGKDGREHKINIKTLKDASKYYPYLTSIACWDGNHGYILLSTDSFIDSEEKDFLQTDIDRIFRVWNRAKRMKKPFDEEECLKEISWSGTHDDVLRIMISRVARDGKKADFSDIHLPRWERLRRSWFEEMVRLGWSEIKAFHWCFNEFFPKETVITNRLGRPLKDETY